MLIAIVGGRPQAKVSDLGLAKALLLEGQEAAEAAGGDDEHTLGVGTLRYMAPELLGPAERGQYSAACDVYSFGSLLWEVRSNASQRPPLPPNACRFREGDCTVLEPTTCSSHANVSHSAGPRIVVR